MGLHALHKKILAFSPKPDEFLHGLSSNTPDAPKNAFLDVRGKIVATADQLRMAPDEVLEIVEAPFAERLKSHLAKYLLVSDTAVREVEGLRAYYDLSGSEPVPEDGYSLPQQAGKIVLSPAPLRADVSEPDFTRFRLDHGIAVQGKDYDEEMLLNLGDPRFVSYDKGCFLGQEIIARVHYRSRPPRRLEVVEAAEGEARLEVMTSRLFDPDKGVHRGFLFVENAA